jgi:DNA ligase (NAD+)
MKRGQAEERLKALGASVKAAIVKDLSYLVTNNPESGSSKNKKARELGVPIIDEAEFLALLAEPSVPAAKLTAKLTAKPKEAQQELF